MVLKSASSSSSADRPPAATPLTLVDMPAGKHVSARALEAIMKTVKDSGLPTATSRSTFARQRKAIAYEVTPYGPIVVSRPLVLHDGKSWDCYFQHPFAMLHSALTSSAYIRSVFRKMCDENSNLLHCIFYTDGVTPGNVVRKDNRLSIHAIYWSIEEFGYPLLSDEDFWFTAGAPLQTHVNELVVDDLHAVFRELLLLFWPGDGTDGTTGLRLPIEACGSERLVFFTYGFLIEDERAHKAVVNSKGSGGAKPCLLCQNCVKPGSRFDPDPTGFCKPYTVLDLDQFIPQTSSIVRGLLKHLDMIAATEATSLLADTEISYGINRCENSWILADSLQFVDFVEGFMFDWFHCYLERGVFDNELDAFLEGRFPGNRGVDEIHEFLQLWRWPRAYANPANVFRKGSFSASGSESLSLAPVLAIYLQSQTLADGGHAADVQSLLAAIDVLDLLANCQVKHRVPPIVLKNAIDRHFSLRSAAYGNTLVKPKCHYSLHFWRHLERFGFLVATFTHERKHKNVKAFANNRHFVGTCDKGLIEDLTMQQMKALSDKRKPGSMRTPTVAPIAIIDALTADGHCNAGSRIETASARVCHGRTISNGDVVLVSDTLGGFQCGEVYFHFSVDGLEKTCLAIWPILHRTSHKLQCKVSSVTTTVLADSLLDACIFSIARVGQLSHVLIPPLCRDLP